MTAPTAPTARPSAGPRSGPAPAAGPQPPAAEPPRAAAQAVLSGLHASLSDPALESMNFLNEVASRYPDAISFASGRPYEEYFDIGQVHRYLEEYCRHLAADLGMTGGQVSRLLLQYGRTKGIIHDLIARNLAYDEGIAADPETIVVTVGCQEAMFVVIRALRADEKDVLLAASPTYVGLTGAARLADMPVWPVPTGPDGLAAADLAEQAGRARAAGLRPRACYVMPDFSNPTGASMSVPARCDLLRTAAEQGVLLLEDNPYGLFHEGAHLPTLKALDDRQQVVYLGTFAKTGFPGARVGYVVADQRVVSADGSTSLFADELSKIKSMLTVNTSPVAQALVGGKLLLNGCRLTDANTRETAVYLRNLALVRDGLASRFPDAERIGVSWNEPTGGFFLVVTLPFEADDALLEHSARAHGVLWTPMSHFYDGGGGERQARLACSQLTSEQVETGLDRFAAMVRERLARENG